MLAFIVINHSYQSFEKEMLDTHANHIETDQKSTTHHAAAVANHPKFKISAMVGLEGTEKEK